MLWTTPPSARECPDVGAAEAPRFAGANHQAVTTIGLDIAKLVFQVHGVGAEGKAVIRRSIEAPLCSGIFSKAFLRASLV